MPKVFPDYKKEARSRVIQAAKEVFSRKGYHATSMDDIAGELGVSRGAVYLYFKSKESILQEIFIQNQQLLRARLEQYTTGLGPMQTAERLFDDVLEAKRLNMPIHFEVISLASHDEAIKKVLLEDNGKDLEVVQAFVQRHIDKGNIRGDVSARIVSQQIISLYLWSMEKLIIGVDASEVRQSWLESLAVILGIDAGSKSEISSKRKKTGRPKGVA